MRAVILTLALLALSVSAGHRRLQHFPRKSADTTISAQNQGLGYIAAVSARASTSTLQAYFSTTDLVACVFAPSANGGVSCFDSASSFATGASQFINSTALIMNAPTAFFPYQNSHYSVIQFLDTGFFANSKNSYNLDSFAVVQVDSNNLIERYFEFNDLAAEQSNHTAMKQTLTQLYEYYCGKGLNSTLELFANDAEIIRVSDSHATFSNLTTFATDQAPFFKDRVRGSCSTTIEHIGVAGNYVYAQRHTMWELNLGVSTGHHIERGVDILYLTPTTGGNLAIADWYFYFHSK